MYVFYKWLQHKHLIFEGVLMEDGWFRKKRLKRMIEEMKEEERMYKSDNELFEMKLPYIINQSSVSLSPASTS